jgi:uncharacterized protein
MNKEQKFSEEFISAFVDDELTPEEKAQVYVRLAEDEALNIQVCELRKVRDLVALAYRNVPAPAPNVSAVIARQKSSTAVAAGLALVIGSLGGWFLHPQATSPQNTAVAQAQPGSEDLAKVLFHVSDDDMGHLKTVLDEVESLMKFYRHTHQKARVEVITNGSGLSLLMADVSPFADRIQRIACQNTIDRVRQEQGVTAKLLPGVVVIDSGVAQIMRRQHQGWAYIQV